MTRPIELNKVKERLPKKRVFKDANETHRRESKDTAKQYNI